MTNGTSSKRIQLYCHEPYVLRPAYQQPWSDVWIRYKTRPGRVHRYGPTLISLPDQRRTVDFLKGFYRNHPEFEDDTEEVSNAEKVLARLEKGETVVEEGTAPGFNCPTIYTPANGIDRAEAERMIYLFLASVGVRRAKLVWKRPSILAIPT